MFFADKSHAQSQHNLMSKNAITQEKVLFFNSPFRLNQSNALGPDHFEKVSFWANLRSKK